MRNFLDILRAPAFGIRTLHEARQYAIKRQQFADAYRTGYARGYQAGKQEQP